MRRILLPVLLSLTLAVPSDADAVDAPEQWTNSFGMSFRLIPAGKTVLGRYNWAGVSPRREVRISREFGMGTTEVTQAQWKAVMGDRNPSEPFLGKNLPVNQVSWDDAQRFVKKLNELDAPRRYRLPTSAEWEHAYRAGNQATWITGDGTPAFPKDLREYEWFGNCQKIMDVASKKPNAWGMYDMGGNVREWVQDFWHPNYYGTMPDVDPTGPAHGNMRVVRGGSYEDPLEACSFVSRDGAKPRSRNKWTGFRVAMEGESLRDALGSMNGAGGEAPATLPAADTVPADVPAAFVPVLDRMHDLLAKGLKGRDPQDGEYGVMERWAGEGSLEALAGIGWALLDLSGDGKPELLIAHVAKNAEGRNMGSELCAIYTEKDGKALLVQEGTARNAFALKKEGSIIHHGSGGASISIFGSCRLTEDGTKLVWDKYLFTMSKDDPREIGFYHNTTGKLEKKGAQELDKASFEMRVDALMAQRVEMPFTPFTEWRAAARSSDAVQIGTLAPGVAPAVTIKTAKEALADALSSESVKWLADGEHVEVALCAQRAVKDLRLLDLEFVGVTDEGKVEFKTAEVFRRDKLEPKRPLIVMMPMIGSTPNAGFSYVDEDGKTYRFTVSLSGEDGSLELMPF